MALEAIIGIKEKKCFTKSRLSAQVSLSANVANGTIDDGKTGEAMDKMVGLGDGQVARVAIDNDNFEIAVGLMGKVGEEAGEILLLVQGGNDDRESGNGHNRM